MNKSGAGTNHGDQIRSAPLFFVVQAIRSFKPGAQESNPSARRRGALS